jgi:predicted Zn-dependent peptidase
MDLLNHTLSNGIRLVHQRIQGHVAHCGIVINAGSRDEAEHEHGIAHFIEHMLFKGTTHRKAYHILSRLEDVGGELNAYTTKEETAIHASFLKDDYERTVELISDIAFHSVFPQKEIEREKDVILDEINSYFDTPSELIFDDFEELVFNGQPIGRSILGSPASVKSFSQEKISYFIGKNYNTPEIVFCSVGNIEDKDILKLFGKYFSEIPFRSENKRLSSPWFYKPASVTRQKDTYQNHYITGNIAYDLKDPKRMGMFLINNILGGPGLNSRLNLSLREKNGLAYNVESSYNPYTDTGIFVIYFGTDPKTLEKSISICMKELAKLRTEKMGAIQFSKAKNQMKGYLARAYESHESLMLALGKNILVYDRVDSFEENLRKIDAITPSDLLGIANEVFEPSRLASLLYK